MSRKKEKQPEPFIYEYISKYCKVENGKVVGLDMEKIQRKQREIDALINQPTASEWKKKGNYNNAKKENDKAR